MTPTRESRPGANRTANNALSISIVQPTDDKHRETRLVPAWTGPGIGEHVDSIELCRHGDELVDFVAHPGDVLVLEAGNLPAPPLPVSWSRRRADLRVVASVTDPKLIGGWKGFLGPQAEVGVAAA